MNTLLGSTHKVESKTSGAEIRVDSTMDMQLRRQQHHIGLFRLRFVRGLVFSSKDEIQINLSFEQRVLELMLRYLLGNIVE